MKNIGIDIGKKKCDACVMDGRGRVLHTGTYENTKDGAGRFAREMKARYGRCRAACETTANMWRITFDAFEREGIGIKLANTFKMSIISKTGKKTDKVDAKKIADILRTGMIPECYVPDLHIRGLRDVTRQKMRMTQDRTRVINRMHSMLDGHGAKIDAAEMYSPKALDQLNSTRLNSVHEDMVLGQRVRHMSYLTDELAEIDSYIERHAADNEYARLLTSMTGVGPYIALVLAAEIADIERFKTPKHMVSWAGLCPVVYQSGDKLYTGRIKKLDTNKIVNWVMCEAANVAVRYDVKMKATYEASKRRHADKHSQAIISVAKKMITIMWHMLHTGTPYESRNDALYRRKLAKLERARARKAA